MRFKRIPALLLALVLTAAPALGRTEETMPEEEAPARILVVYPEEMDRRTGPDNLSSLAQVLLSLRYTADYVEAAKAAEAIGRYENVIWFAASDSKRMDPAVLKGYTGRLLALGQGTGLEAFGIYPRTDMPQDAGAVAEYTFIDDYAFRSSVLLMNPSVVPDAVYSAGWLNASGQTAPLTSGRDGVYYIPLMDYTENFAKAVLMQEIAQWLWPYESRMHTYTEHLVLSELYPFSDLYRLRDLVQYMVDQKMNFVLSVMPIYDHADYPAMQQFCEVLRFAQANGGAVVLHAPIVQNGIDAETLSAKLTEAIKNYLNHDVYLLGMEIPSEWLFREDLRSIVGRNKTIFLSEMDAFASHAVSEYRLEQYINLGSQQIAPAIRLDELGVSHLARCSSAVYLNMGDTEDKDLYAAIDAVKNAPIPMQSLWDMEETVYADEGQYLIWDKNTLTVNGEQRFNVYTPRETDENFNYRRDVYYRFVANLTQQNYYLIGLSTVVLIVFLALGRRSRKQMHKRFLKKIVPEEGKERVGG